MDSALVKVGQVYQHKQNKEIYVILQVGVNCAGRLRDEIPTGCLIVYQNTKTNEVYARNDYYNEFSRSDGAFARRDACHECFKHGEHKMSCQFGMRVRELKGNYERPH